MHKLIMFDEGYDENHGGKQFWLIGLRFSQGSNISKSLN